MASIRGLDRALLEYPVTAGLIFCLDRTFDERLNTIIVEKAIAYRHRGVVGIDIAGPRHPDFHYRDYAALFKKARKAGLGLTVHAGEEEDWQSVDEVLRYLEPDRVGHGIHAAQDHGLCKRLAERGVLLEICPSSNLDTKVVKDADELGEYIATFKRHKVRFCFNTDGPEMLETTLRDYDPEARVMSGREAELSARLEDQIATLDGRLAQLGNRSAEAQLVDLWRQRVDLMQQLVQVHVARAKYVGL